MRLSSQLTGHREGTDCGWINSRLLSVRVLKRCALIALLAVAHALSGEVHAAILSACIVLFVPADADPAEAYEERLGSLAHRTESFLKKWMTHWSHAPSRSTLFSRTGDANGKSSIQVTLVRGDLGNRAGREALPEIRRQAIEGAARILGVSKDDGVVWWILYGYPDVKGFQGGGNTSGGIAINRFPPGVGKIPSDLEMASPELAETNVKGTIHEFGQALGLPHTGPRLSLNLGNSLMGPINRAFWQKENSRDTRVYLTDSSAAILAGHPIFSQHAREIPELPKRVEITELTARENDAGSIKVSGRLKSESRAHSAVLFDSGRGSFGQNDWARSYVGDVDQEGRFEVTVDDPLDDPLDEGTLFLSFCFENGIATADGKRQLLRGSVIEIPYSGSRQNRTFRLP